MSFNPFGVAVGWSRSSCGDGRRLARARLPEGLEGITRLHALIAEHMPASRVDIDPVEAAGRVRIGIETDRGTWVQALFAAGSQRAISAL